MPTHCLNTFTRLECLNYLSATLRQPLAEMENIFKKERNVSLEINPARVKGGKIEENVSVTVRAAPLDHSTTQCAVCGVRVRS